MRFQKRLLFIFLCGTLLSTPVLITLGAEGTRVTNYNLPAQSWKFIEIGNLTSKQLVDFDWQTGLVVQGKQVSEEQYLTLQSATPSERVQYFETLNYFEGKHDYGRATADATGKLWFVFYNSQTTATTLTVTLILRNNSLLPWQVGLIASVVTVLLLGLVILITYRLRRKMLEEQLAREKSPAERYFEM